MAGEAEEGSPSSVLRLLVNGTRGEGGEVSEARRRQAQWERQLESLDKKEIELHQTQLRLVRDHTASFIRDLNVLRQEVIALKAGHEKTNERVNFVETFIGDSVEKRAIQGQDSFRSSARLSEPIARQAKEPCHGGSLKERMMLLEDMVGNQGHHATIAERLRYMEKVIGDSADKHDKELKALKLAHDKHASEVNEVQAGHHANLAERVQYLEQFLGDSADKHAKVFDAMRDSQAKFAAQHAKHGKDLEGLKNLHQSHATLGERLEFLEKMFGDHADKHAQELALVRAAHDVTSREILKAKDAQSKLASETRAQLSTVAHTGERLDVLEHRLRQCFAS